MSILQNSAEGGTNGAAVTALNSDAGSGDKFNAVTPASGGTVTYDTAGAAHGTLGYNFTSTGSGSGLVTWTTGVSSTSLAVRFYFNPGPSLPNAQLRLLDLRNSTTTAARIVLTSANRLSIQNTAGTTLFTSATALSPNTWYRIETAVSVSASAATMKYDYYLLDSGSPVETGYSTNTGNTGTTNVVNVTIGSAAAATNTGTFYMDDMAVSTGSTTYVGAAVVTVPSAPSGATATAVTGGATVTFTAPTSFGGSAVTGYTATSTPGSFTSSISGSAAAPITFSGLTVGTSYTFTVHATNAAGNSAESSASNAVVPTGSTVTKTNNAEGGTNGTTLTTTNSGGASGNAFNLVSISGGSSVQFSSAGAAHGALGYALNMVSGNVTNVTWNAYNDTQLAVRFYYNPGPSLPGTLLRLLDIRNSSGTAARINLTTTNNLSLQNTAGTTLFTSATALSANTWYRIECAISVSTTNATIKYDYYALDSTTPVEAGYATTTGNTGSTNLTNVNIGSSTAAAWTGTSYLDDLATSTNTTTYIGPAAVAPPIVSAGSPQSVAPYSSVTLSGTATPTTGHTATIAWTALGGAPAITSGATTLTPTIANIGGPTVASGGDPADTPYTYQITATQDDSQTATSTVTITVLYANRYAARSGSWAPMVPTKRAHGSAWV